MSPINAITIWFGTVERNVEVDQENDFFSGAPVIGPEVMCILARKMIEELVVLQSRTETTIVVAFEENVAS